MSLVKAALDCQPLALAERREGKRNGDCLPLVTR